MVKPSARKTTRLVQMQLLIGHGLGGEPGSRLLANLSAPASADTLLRLVRKSTSLPEATPKVLGVDEWAWRKGQSYGTILVDLDKRKPVDLLPDRSAESLCNWLQSHPGVKIISRDRSRIYADGASRGAPEAIQIADRWHLLLNLTQMVMRLMQKHQVRLPGKVSLPDEIPVADEQLSKAEQIRHTRRSKRLSRYREVMVRLEQGQSIRSIARECGINRKTIRKFIRTGTFPEISKRRPASSKLDPFKSHIDARWTEGYRSITGLFKEITLRGFNGSYRLVSRYVAKIREETPLEDTAQPQPPPFKRISPRQASWLMVLRRDDLTGTQEEDLKALLEICPDAEEAYPLVQTFGQMVRERKPHDLDSWIDDAQSRKIPEMNGFAVGLRQDKAAVRASLEHPWSNGPVEGHIHRLKLIKRQMYGRAGFDLLKQRVLYAA